MWRFAFFCMIGVFAFPFGVADAQTLDARAVAQAYVAAVYAGDDASAAAFYVEHTTELLPMERTVSLAGLTTRELDSGNILVETDVTNGEQSGRGLYTLAVAPTDDGGTPGVVAVAGGITWAQAQAAIADQPVASAPIVPERAAPIGRGCPSDQPIKGNRGRLGWIYHTSFSRSYGATIPEECFATEAAATAAGYRAARD